MLKRKHSPNSIINSGERTVAVLKRADGTVQVFDSKKFPFWKRTLIWLKRKIRR